MELALDEGAKGLGLTRPNPPVGAVMVKDGRFLSKGYHAQAGGPHAEVVAIEAAAPRDVEGATLYVTLEPCSTKGKTPACTAAIQKAGIQRVVVGSLDPNAKHYGRGVEWLREQGIEVKTGVLEERCGHLIRFFERHVTSGIPYVIAKAGMTLDGRITPPPGGSRWITGEMARWDVQRLRSQVDAIVIGGETLRRDDPELTLRGVYARANGPEPLRVVVTRSGELPEDAKLFTDSRKHLTRVFHVEQLELALKDLGDEGITSVLLECGGRLMGHAFERELVNEVTFYLAPIIGGGAARAVEGQGFRCQLEEMKWDRIGRDLRVNARVVYPDAT